MAASYATEAVQVREPEIKNPRLRMQSIQVLRAVAASLVVYDHVGHALERLAQDGILHHPSWLAASGFSSIGACGVDLFFIISGFIMVCTTDGKSGRTRALQFLKRRALRIYPLYWFWSTVYFFLAAFHIVSHVRQHGFVATATTYTLFPYFNGTDFKPPISAGWTLSYEMLFYFIFAISIWAGIRMLRLPFVAAVFLLLAGVGLLLPVNHPLRYLFTDPVILSFLFGIVAGETYLWAQRKNFQLPRAIALLSIGLGAAGLICSVMVESTEANRAFIWGIPSFLIILGAIFYRTEKYPRLLVYLGDASYSIYLTHWIFTIGCLPFIRHLSVLQNMNGDLELLLIGTSAIACTAWSYKLVELPLKRLAERIIP